MAEPIFKQVETIQLAPDALVYINGKDTVKDADGNNYEIRNDITDISVDLDISSSPGSASFNITMPDHSIRRFGNRRYTTLRLMSEIEIYFKGRFPTIMDDGRIFYPYYPCFWGVLTSINENYSDGQHTISVTCADILRWWEMTILTVSASASAVNASNAETYRATSNVKDPKSYNAGILTQGADGRMMSPFGNINAGMTIPDILISLASISLSNIAPIINFSTHRFGTADKIDGTVRNDNQDVEREIMYYWNERLAQVGRNLRLYAMKIEKTIETITKEDNGTKISVAQTRYVTKFDHAQLIEAIPYALDEDKPSGLQSKTIAKLEIAKKCAEVINFEFFMDVNGELIFKPPFYNLDVRQNQNSVINDIDIISWGFTQSEAEVCSRLDVSGAYLKEYQGSENADVIRGIAINIDLAQRFGVRAQERSVRWLNSSERCLQYAQMEINRMGALLMQGTITIMGRPELRLGYPVYVPSRDAFYYIKGISHSFSFGGSFNTTLTLIAERNRRLDGSKNPIKNLFFRAVGELTDNTKTIDGNSVSQPTVNDNFLSQITELCIPNKKTTVEQVIEPNFISSNENVKSMQQGTWEKVTNIDPKTIDSTKIIQITDSDGYELVPFFGYCSQQAFDLKSTVQPLSTLKSTATKAQELTPEDYLATANPNNVAITLEDEDASMLSIYNKTASSVATRVQNMDIK